MYKIFWTGLLFMMTVLVSRILVMYPLCRLFSDIALLFLFLSYQITQFSFAVLNFRQQQKQLQEKQSPQEGEFRDICLQDPPTICILLIGYRENPVYWELCLQSIHQTTYSGFQGLFVFIDGDQQEDQYMKDIFLQQPQKPDCLYEIHLCPHRGKRFCMTAGFSRIQEVFPTNSYVIVMDSDTIILPLSVSNLVRCIDHDPQNACATGSLRIFHQRNLLQSITNARFGYAFDVERGAMSYAGCMNCCSGPFSIYRQCLLTPTFLHDFLSQSFCGKQVGPGDDRHATVLLLLQGYHSRQTPFAHAYTETPLTFTRFLLQQLRWMRSYYREQLWQIRACPQQHPYLVMVTLYEFFFPFFLLSSIYTEYQIGQIDGKFLEKRLLTMVGILLIRTSFLTIMTRDFRMMFNVFMLPLYMGFLLPLKFYALCTCHIQNWLTSSRNFLFSPHFIQLLGITISILLYYSALSFFFFFKTIKNLDR